MDEQGASLVGTDGAELVDASGAVVDGNCPECCDGSPPPTDCCVYDAPGFPERRHECGRADNNRWVGRITLVDGQYTSTTTSTRLRRYTEDVVEIVNRPAFEQLFGSIAGHPYLRWCEFYELLEDGQTTTTGSRTVSNRAPGCGEGTGCQVGMLVPLREVDFVQTRGQVTATQITNCNGRVPQVTQRDINDDQQFVNETCQPAGISCWPLGLVTTTDGTSIPGFAGLDLIGAHGRTVPTQVSSTRLDDPGNGVSVVQNPYGGTTTTTRRGTTTTTASTTLSGSRTFLGGANNARSIITGNTVTAGSSSRDLLIEERVIFNVPGIGSGSFLYRIREQIDEQTQTTQNARIEVQGEFNWRFNCDNSVGGFRACEDTLCQDLPSELKYIVGVPCGGASRPMFVLPVENVRACGLVQFDDWCYKFTPQGQRIINPADMGATIGNDVVTERDPQDCCVCMSGLTPECSGSPIPLYDEWRNGIRLPNGIWQTYPMPASGGLCCCSEGDRFRLVRASAREVAQYGSDGSEEVVFVTRLLPLIFQGTGRQDPFDGFRRVPLPNENPELGWTIEEESLFQGQTVNIQQRLGTAGREPVGCEWGWTLFRSPFAIGLASLAAFIPMPRAIDADANGELPGGVRLLRYNVLANCGSLFAQVEAEQVEAGGQRIRYVSALVEWVIERNPTGPCEGGCGSGGLLQQVFGPGRSDCSTCGGTGRLSVG